MPIYVLNIQLVEGVSAERAAFKIDTEVLPRLAYRDEDRINILAIPDLKTQVVNPEELSIEVFGVPRYPTQLFEALGYFLSFIILLMFYIKTDKRDRLGFSFGLFLVLIFGFRFFIEYIKEDQVSFESTMALNMGQWLSIPLVLVGLYFIITSNKRINA